jgi:hypothetical protein
MYETKRERNRVINFDGKIQFRLEFMVAARFACLASSPPRIVGQPYTLVSFRSLQRVAQTMASS